MKTNILGNTGIKVTELCLGTLPMGPLQKDMSLKECTHVVETALKRGITFIDTAQMYKTYDPIREAIKSTGIRAVIATKCTASDYAGMEDAIKEALEQLDIDFIDILLLHAARAGPDVFELRAGAIECMKDYKRRGLVRATGISTHSVQVTKIAATLKDMEVVFPIINKNGMGIIDGTAEDMKKAVLDNHAAGKGVYLMKALAGGNLINDYTFSIDFARGVKGCASIAIGMVSPEEVNFNVDYFSGTFDRDKTPTVKGYSKKYQVAASLCKGCKACIAVCPNYAIEFDEEQKKAYIDEQKCLTCGYCTSACGEFAIRIV